MTGWKYRPEQYSVEIQASPLGIHNSYTGKPQPQLQSPSFSKILRLSYLLS